ncbi:DUF1129 domain-containing protein [Streptococcus loxodontisalivarius]|uniref:Membrane-anchored protein n=1 Tax=Streptococcus loxodontisalivarius TaxID=1349415 RepID=A0ABS2PPX1_9STRE|nr:DUF1129 family protein [Streptococcus loxodontisalivarius]MBM7642091.1 putative membrane-anchored protein [Streptococcus loxodontisalivarius]
MDLQNLTKKNQEFINIATHQLIRDGKTDQEIKTILEEALPTILENQEKGIPARTALGAPTVWAAAFTPKESDKAAEVSEKDTTPWRMWLNTSLWLFGLFALVTGLLSLVSTNYPQYGILTLLVLGFGGGAVMYGSYHYIYRFQYTEQRVGFLKTILIMFVMLILWMLLFGLTALIPSSINITVSSIFSIVLGAIVLVGQYFFRKKYNIESAWAPRQNIK